MEPILASFIVFAAALAVFMGIEALWHKITKNRSRAYRPGVIVLAILFAIYAYLTSVGR